MQPSLYFLLAILAFTLAAPIPAQTIFLTDPFEKDGQWAVKLHNTGPLAISAYLVEAEVKGGQRRRLRISKYMDELVNASQDKPLRPDGSATIVLGPLGTLPAEDTKISFAGAILEDGSVVGPQSGAAILVGRRKELSAELTELMRLMSATAGKDKSALKESVLQRARETKEKGQELTSAEIPMLAARTMATDWLAGSLDLIPDSCTGECFEKRMKFLQSLLTNWRNKLRQDTVNVRD